MISPVAGLRETATAEETFVMMTALSENKECDAAYSAKRRDMQPS